MATATPEGNATGGSTSPGLGSFIFLINIIILLPCPTGTGL